MPNLRILSQDYPQRRLALVTNDYALIFQHSPADSAFNIPRRSKDTPRCLVELVNLHSVDLKGYRVLGGGNGTLGLITLDDDVFLCVVTGSSRAATVRPGETISRIDNVEFYCLSHSEYENGLDYESETSFAVEEFGLETSPEKEVVTDHPFLALKRLLSDGSFYYSLDFNLTDRLQDRSDKSAALDIDSLDEDMLWNLHMIHPLLLFRSHLSLPEKEHLDHSRVLTCIMRGYASTLTIPASIPILPQAQSRFPSTITIISRQSSRRAGTRFNSRGIDDDGHVANFVETETILWTPPGITFSYVQVRGSVPIFWEQAAGLLPGQQKIEVTRPSEATQHAFNKHFEALELEYGAVHIVNLLSELKLGETELSTKFCRHVDRSPLHQNSKSNVPSDHTLLRMTNFDFHAESRGPLGYGASNQIRHEIAHSLFGFAYFLSEDISENISSNEKQILPESSSVILQQEGVFRTNCLDCLDRTNLVQSIISSMALESFMLHQGGKVSSEVQLRHSTLWADNGDALSKIYAGTGALKSSFTRHGKMSLAGALADARKTATRLYVNNFSDKARQKTIDLLLGQLTGQAPVNLYDPVNDLVSEELGRHASEYSHNKSVDIWAGTFNVNGRVDEPDIDLSQWLLPQQDHQNDGPVIFAIGLQEIVSLSPQQIMSTDPTTRKVWESAISECLNSYAKLRGGAKYVLLRSGQLVGTALMIYVRKDVLKDIKNVEGGVKKTGLSGMAGNKGGCAIRFEISNTRVCFVTAHLAAGFANYDERNNDYETISHGLRFQKNRTIEDHDAIIWLGDFNYRVGLSNQHVRELVAQTNYWKLYNNDQLNLQMLAGRAFQFYTEGPIAFAPTYKYDIHSDFYDTSEKARAPAWCDRILWRGSILNQTGYNSANLRFSDHRPVWATFSCIISVVDEGRRANLRHVLYNERKRDVHDVLSSPTVPAKIDDEGIFQLEPTVPGLPPASSDNRKWWLENGGSAKSSARPPTNRHIFNVNRKSNPFSPDEESDWISLNSDVVAAETPPLPPRSKYTSTAVQSSMQADTSGSQKRENKAKEAPPIPRKPVSLSSGHDEGRNMITSTSENTLPDLGVQLSGRDGSFSPQSSREESLTLLPKVMIGPRQLNGHSAGRAGDLLGSGVDEVINWKPLNPQ